MEKITRGLNHAKTYHHAHVSFYGDTLILIAMFCILIVIFSYEKIWWAAIPITFLAILLSVVAVSVQQDEKRRCLHAAVMTVFFVTGFQWLLSFHPTGPYAWLIGKLLVILIITFFASVAIKIFNFQKHQNRSLFVMILLIGVPFFIKIYWHKEETKVLYDSLDFLEDMCFLIAGLIFTELFSNASKMQDNEGAKLNVDVSASLKSLHDGETPN